MRWADLAHGLGAGALAGIKMVMLRPLVSALTSLLALLVLSPAALAQDRPSGEVLWDTYGVPHVYAKTVQGLFYGFGWAQMKSHGDLVLRLYAEGRGRAAEYYGREELDSDRWMMINDVPGRAQSWLGLQSPGFRSDLQAFADGMNAYAAAHPETLTPASRRVTPISATDVVSYAHRLFQYVYLAPQGVADHLPPDSAASPTSTAELAGSNGWAIGPSRSASGKTMMLMNPHLPWGPGWSTYYEAELSAPGISLYGATQIGLPVLRFVFSDQLGITNTVDKTNGMTLYKVLPKDGGYLFDGEVRPFTVRSTVLKVRREDGGFDQETVDVRSTVHGPIVGSRDGALIALRVAGLDRPRALEQYWKMETAKSFSDYQAALRLMQVPTFNIIYGDRDGHIEYLFNGLVPRHTFGDLPYWSGVVPGDSARTLWSDYLSYDELPKVIDPPGGTVQNSNDPPWDAGYPALLDPSSYRAYIPANPVSLRMARGVRMLGEEPLISFEQLEKDRWSTRSELADRLLPDLQIAVARYGSDLAKEAVGVLERWDRTTDAESRGCLLFLAWTEALKHPDGYSAAGFATPYDLSQPLTTPAGLVDPAAAAVALDQAAKTMLAQHQALDAPWASVMRLRWGGLDLPASGGPGNLGVFNVLIFGAAKDGIRSAIFGSSFVALVSFDSPARAKVLMSYGQSTQPGSAHASDQLALLSSKKMRDAWRTRVEVMAHLESRDAF